MYHYNEFLHKHGAKVDICKGYGMTESVAATAYTFPGTNEPGSIGIPMVGNINSLNASVSCGIVLANIVASRS